MSTDARMKLLSASGIFLLVSIFIAAFSEKLWIMGCGFIGFLAALTYAMMPLIKDFGPADFQDHVDKQFQEAKEKKKYVTAAVYWIVSPLMLVGLLWLLMMIGVLFIL